MVIGRQAVTSQSRPTDGPLSGSSSRKALYRVRRPPAAALQGLEMRTREEKCIRRLAALGNGRVRGSQVSEYKIQEQESLQSERLN